MESPFSPLDHLYVLLMMKIPAGVLSDTMSLLHLDQSPAFERYARSLDAYRYEKRPEVTSLRSALGLSSTEFHLAISNLYSVLEVTTSEDGEPEKFHFYHKSFLDFLLDSRRSKQYFIKSPVVHQRCLKMIIRTMSTAVGSDASEYPKLWLYFPEG
jgi:hypothetical protein